MLFFSSGSEYCKVCELAIQKEEQTRRAKEKRLEDITQKQKALAELNNTEEIKSSNETVKNPYSDTHELFESIRNMMLNDEDNNMANQLALAFEQNPETEFLAQKLRISSCYYEAQKAYHRGNYTRAFEYFTVAAEGGNEDAQYHLALCYANGQGTRKNEALASKWFIMSASSGNAFAQNEIAIRYLEGNGIERDLDQAYSWAKKAADRRNIDALVTLGLICEKEQNYEEAFSYYNDAAQRGNMHGMGNVGKAYLLGRGVQKDPKNAFYWNSKAAELGEPSSQYNLGLQYVFGDGVERDFNEGVFWLIKAAAQGHNGAISKLAPIGITDFSDEMIREVASHRRVNDANSGTAIDPELDKDEEDAEEDEYEDDEAYVSPEPWWPYQWFRCDCCECEWQDQYVKGPYPRCPRCGDSDMVSKLLKGF